MIEHLNALQRAGVACVKIEGRMKKPEYVAAVTRCYRAALDGADASTIARLKQELFAFFNRGDFNTSHLYRDSVKTDRVGNSKPDKAALAAARQSIQGENRRREVDMTLTLSVGSAAQLNIADGEHAVSMSGAVVQTASKPQQAELYAERLKKLGNTPFVAQKCTVRMNPDCYISAAELNALRRECINEMLNMYHVRNTVPVFDETAAADVRNIRITADRQVYSAGFLYARVSNVMAAEAAAKAGAEFIAFEPCTFDDNATQINGLLKLREKFANGQRLLLALPNVIITEKQHQCFRLFAESGAFDGIETNNIGQIAFFDYFKNDSAERDAIQNEKSCKKHAPLSDGFIRIAGIGMNAMNSFTMKCLTELGYDYIMPSPELTGVQLASIAEHSALADRMLIGIHGRTPLMQLLHCPIKEHKGCQNCMGIAGAVTDEAGRVFPLVNIRYPDNCLVRMLNCRTTDLIDLFDRIPQTAGYVLNFVGEQIDEVTERIAAANEAMNGKRQTQYPNSTRGHWVRKVE